MIFIKQKNNNFLIEIYGYFIRYSFNIIFAIYLFFICIFILMFENYINFKKVIYLNIWLPPIS